MYKIIMLFVFFINISWSSSINAQTSENDSYVYSSDEDISDLRKGVQYGIDYIAASFVDSADDISFIRGAIGGSDVGIIAKIESAQGVEHLDSIIAASDGIMVARGDLGIEIAPEEVPGVQKRMIRLCRHARKPVITATR